MFCVRMLNEDIYVHVVCQHTYIAKAKLTKIYVTGQHSYLTYLLFVFGHRYI